jgi:hypothetical protein
MTSNKTLNIFMLYMYLANLNFFSKFGEFRIEGTREEREGNGRGTWHHNNTEAWMACKYCWVMREREGNGSRTWKHNTSKSGWRANTPQSWKNEGGIGEFEGNVRGTRVTQHGSLGVVKCISENGFILDFLFKINKVTSTPISFNIIL